MKPFSGGGFCRGSRWAVHLVLAALIWQGCGRYPDTGSVDDRPFDNLVLITLDTLRADHLGSYGYPRPVSPFLDSLAGRGVRFDRVISSSSHTGPSHASMFTSLYPAQHQVVANGIKLDPRIPTLASMLTEWGFNTRAFVSMGFLKSVSPGFVRVDGEHGPLYRPAEVTVDLALDWFDQRRSKKRLFLWIHLFDIHNSLLEHGQEIPQSQLAMMQSDRQTRGDDLATFLQEHHGLSGDQIDSGAEIIDRYDAQILFVDENLRRLFTRIEADPKLGRTLWVITSDHGEGLGNHDYHGHGRYIYQEQVRVPLIIYGGEDWVEGEVIDRMVRHVDLLPTVAELLGFPLDREAHGLEGKSLVGLLGGGSPPKSDLDMAVSQRRTADQDSRRSDWEQGLVMSVQDERFKLILHTAGENELFDLQSDPFEVDNLIGKGLEIEGELTTWLTRKYQSMRAGTSLEDDDSRTIDEEYVEQLKSLGYLN